MTLPTTISPAAKEAAEELLAIYSTKGSPTTSEILTVLNLLVDATTAEKDKEIAELKKKLQFLKDKGLTVDYMKTSDKPEPYLVYVAEHNSEFDDTRYVNKVIDAEIERDKALQQLSSCLKDRERLDYAIEHGFLDDFTDGFTGNQDTIRVAIDSAISATKKDEE